MDKDLRALCQEAGEQAAGQRPDLDTPRATAAPAGAAHRWLVRAAVVGSLGTIALAAWAVQWRADGPSSSDVPPPSRAKSVPGPVLAPAGEAGAETVLRADPAAGRAATTGAEPSVPRAADRAPSKPPTDEELSQPDGSC